MFLYKIADEVSLKLIELQDAEQLYKLTDKSRAYLREWLPWLDRTTRIEDTKGYIQGCLQAYADNKGLFAVILFKGEIAGVVSFNSIDWGNKTAQIGYWLDEEFQGNGIMTKAVKALVDYAFSEYKLNKVEIHAAVENQKSRSIPERLGFVREGRIREAEWLYDHYVDHYVYGMLTREWRK
ncbi:GNAT family N-acetyltransferase [Bacillus rubiinfantis]|uniref:GNAT family N-acetyltransferase n=1 Tax=Bacillus rubiinfantis TaxID=1499680 RepID=UPI0005A80411|nr:GNAT family protein [Bacillus rubiinfantis]